MDLGDFGTRFRVLRYMRLSQQECQIWIPGIPGRGLGHHETSGFRSRSARYGFRGLRDAGWSITKHQDSAAGVQDMYSEPSWTLVGASRNLTIPQQECIG